MKKRTKRILIISSVIIALGGTALILKKKGVCCKKTKNQKSISTEKEKILANQLGIKIIDEDNEDIVENEEPDLKF